MEEEEDEDEVDYLEGPSSSSSSSSTSSSTRRSCWLFVGDAALRLSPSPSASPSPSLCSLGNFTSSKAYGTPFVAPVSSSFRRRRAASEMEHHAVDPTIFACFNCNLNLTGYRYILRDEKPFCIKCYESLFANTCEECKTPIGTDSKDLSYKERHWHEKCFKCIDCQITLVDRPFASKNERLYCADCHDNNFAARCDGCGGLFRAGMKKFEYKGKQWHEQCFRCKVCQQPVGSKSFIPRDQEVVCVACYEENYAQRCIKCNGVINKGGITYRNAPWHRDCFTCTHCNRLLAGEKFTSRDEKPFCAECFGELFAKKCCRCTRPITGLGGTKFISFDDRHWHSDCFVCYRCSASLVGRGFLTDGAEVLCPDCGRA